MRDNTQAEVERYHPSYCDKYEVLRGIYPNDRRLTGKDCSCGFEQALLDWHNKQIEAELEALREEVKHEDLRTISQMITARVDRLKESSND